MPLKVGTTGITALYVGTTQITAAYVGTTQVYSSTPPISISGATSYASSGTVGGVGRTKSATTALSVSGGTGTYSYSWTLVSGDAVSVSNTGVLNPTFSASITPDQGTYSTYRLTVTSGAATATYDVNISLNN